MSTPDHGNIVAIECRMKEAARNIHDMEGDMASAITIIDYDSDRRKNLLACHVAEYLNDESGAYSATAAESLARASKAYEEKFNGLFSQYELAQSVKKKYEAEHISWDTARSLLARQRATIETLPDTEA